MFRSLVTHDLAYLVTPLTVRGGRFCDNFHKKDAYEQR
jgi:hypothetical protein